METVRTFVAVELPAVVGETLAEAVGHLSHLDDRVRWVRPENIHLTIKFLGDVQEPMLQQVVAAVQGAVRYASPFTLKTSRVGGGPNLERARVIWVRVAGDVAELSALQTEVETALLALDFPRERREFLPHLTLGRARRRPVELPDEVPCQEVSFRVDRVTVFKSDLRPAGPVYTPLGYGLLAGV